MTRRGGGGGAHPIPFSGRHPTRLGLNRSLGLPSRRRDRPASAGHFFLRKIVRSRARVLRTGAPTLTETPTEEQATEIGDQ